MGQVRGNAAANAARPRDRKGCSLVIGRCCRELQRVVPGVWSSWPCPGPVLLLARALEMQKPLRAPAVTKRNSGPQNDALTFLLSAMPVIRFVREGRDVECYPGENLRDVALREGIELYGLKGRLGNCNGCGQCITCFVEISGGAGPDSLSPRTGVEDAKLKRRPEDWRLACQALVQRSAIVLTKPQTGLPDRDGKIAAARAQELPAGPTAWPVVEVDEDDADESADAGVVSSAEAGVEADAATPGDEG